MPMLNFGGKKMLILQLNILLHVIYSLLRLKD
jgi:hypothetical protein